MSVQVMKDINFQKLNTVFYLQTKNLTAVAGTSMQTAFAYIIVHVANQFGMKIHYINENADEEVPKFLKEYVFLHRENILESQDFADIFL